ncbi:DUF1109 domain-containing protein [Aurantiacibacter poecillastricola]|uniref:DUF1109 domain-containing protein n=1 Tax=Aurantiacibacter poecillastricola TaxID=3064385 RepID=UPI00273F4816|nr:DUF1109 domain-containing protein [Aurantiacibacter sp. 219JJ12-13]MDP5261834.1 DUF1109 domain-containing protein [Aurantiacibacter sp. 219JJ12-13]
MTDTELLLDRLSAEGPEPSASPFWRFAAPLLGVFALCTLGIAATLDGAFDPVERYGVMPLTAKWGFAFALVFLSASALWVLGRPARPSASVTIGMAIPFIFVAAFLALEFLQTGPVVRGATWRTCLLAMAVMSPIGFAGAIFAARWLAPTNLRRTGLSAGLFGGGVAMIAYSPYCPELGMGYMTVFYCLPILAMAALGWLLGPRLLRW